MTDSNLLAGGGDHKEAGPLNGTSLVLRKPSSESRHLGMRAASVVLSPEIERDGLTRSEAIDRFVKHDHVLMNEMLHLVDDFSDGLRCDLSEEVCPLLVGHLMVGVGGEESVHSVRCEVVAIDEVQFAL